MGSQPSSPELDSRRHAGIFSSTETVGPTKVKKKKNTGLRLFGFSLAFLYGMLCGIGVVASVNDAMMSNPALNFSAQGIRALAFALGGINWFVNVGFFCFVVPAMLVRLASWDLFEESYATENGKYVKLKNQDKTHETAHPVRRFLIWSFMFLFGLMASFVYTGLLISKLPETFSLVGIPLGGVGLTIVSGTFFAVSMICNWMFNTYDAAELFTKSDFFEKLWSGTKKLFLIEDDEALINKKETKNQNGRVDDEEKGEVYNPGVWLGEDNVVGWLGMKLRQVQRLAIVGGIAYLAYAALLSVTQMGAPAFLSFMHIPAFPWLTPIIVGTSILGFGLLYGIQTLRFSELAVKLSATFGNFYGKTYNSALKTVEPYAPNHWLPKSFYIIAANLSCSLIPIPYSVGMGLYKIFDAQVNFLSRAISRKPSEDEQTKMRTEYNETEDEEFQSFEAYWHRDGFSAWFQRATYSGISCYQELSQNISVFAFFPALIVTAFNFVRENFYTLTIANAAANGFLAIKPPVENADGVLVPAQSTGETLKAAVGGALMSGMCASNNYKQNRLKEEGVSSDEQVVLDEKNPNLLLYSETGKYLTLDGKPGLKRMESVVIDLKHLPLPRVPSANNMVG